MFLVSLLGLLMAFTWSEAGVLRRLLFGQKPQIQHQTVNLGLVGQNGESSQPVSLQLGSVEPCPPGALCPAGKASGIKLHLGGTQAPASGELEPKALLDIKALFDSINSRTLDEANRRKFDDLSASLEEIKRHLGMHQSDSNQDSDQLKQLQEQIMELKKIVSGQTTTETPILPDPSNS